MNGNAIATPIPANRDDKLACARIAERIDQPSDQRTVWTAYEISACRWATLRIFSSPRPMTPSVGVW